MTDEEIIALAEKTRKEKYCDKYYGENSCGTCPLQFDDETGLYCIQDTFNTYTISFLDGFKAGYKNGQDSMSDYIIELQHAAYDD